ncbi:12987_t:CDS:2, partial [Ambispora gerdemannii]
MSVYLQGGVFRALAINILHGKDIGNVNLAYNILKNLEDDIIRDKEIPELDQSVNIYITGYTLRKASNDHAEYIPIPDYRKNINIIEPFPTNQKSPSSQLGEISALSNRMSESFILSSPILRM